MNISILYFASLRDQMAKADDHINCKTTITVQQAWQLANPDCAIPSNTLVAVNQNYVNLQTELQDHDEVAFFPPVTGG
jgi:molybdopterin synthase sulfur carrier subunit